MLTPLRALQRDLFREQTLELSLDDPIAVAHAFFEPGSVEEGHTAAAVVNEAGLLQLSG